MTARPLFASLVAVVLATAARAERLPMQSDVDKCALHATELGARALQGTLRMQLLVRKDGKVYAAFAHSAKGADDRGLARCLANNALLWQYEGVGVDYSAPFPLSFVMGGAETSGESSTLGMHSGQTAPQAYLPERNPKVEARELDEKLAQETLDVLEDVSPAEHGQAFLAVHKYPEAIGLFRAALAKDANDALALRGLAQALAESAGDLKEARAAAERLAASVPGSVVGEEALLRVCSASGDDLCVVRAWQLATKATDLAPRSRTVSDLQPLAKRSADRLNAARQAGAKPADAPAAAAAPPPDPCALEQGDDRQALCVVKRCFHEGSTLYAKELSVQGVEYTPGDWRLKPVGPGRLLVTRPIGGKAKDGSAAPAHDAMWLVKLGDQFAITASTSDARQITHAHNACAVAKAAEK